MNLKKYDKIARLLKLIELGLLGFLTYYTTSKGQNINIWVLMSIYVLLFAVWIIDFSFNKLHTNNLDLLIKHFYEQNHFHSDADVRITIHKKINESRYKQHVDYYPSGAKRGKTHEIKKGIVKYAFKQTQGEFSENFVTIEEKVEKLMNKYNFRKEEADQQVSDGELSYYCCPIMDDGKIWGVLYMNSKTLYTFPKQEELANSQLSKNVKALIKMIENEID